MLQPHTCLLMLMHSNGQSDQCQMHSLWYVEALETQPVCTGAYCSLFSHCNSTRTRTQPQPSKALFDYFVTNCYGLSESYFKMIVRQSCAGFPLHFCLDVWCALFRSDAVSQLALEQHAVKERQKKRKPCLFRMETMRKENRGLCGFQRRDWAERGEGLIRLLCPRSVLQARAEQTQPGRLDGGGRLSRAG